MPGELDDATQLHFAPSAADVGRAQRLDEALRFALEFLIGHLHGFERGPDAGGVADALPLDFVQLDADLRQRVADRRDQRIELLVTLAEIGGGFLVHVADLLIGELQEFIGVGLERGRGERLERIAQLILLRAAAARREQPAGREPRHQRADDENSNFQRLQCNLPICQARSKAVTEGRSSRPAEFI